MLNHVVDIISLQQPEYEMERIDISDYYNFFEIGYYGHPNLPYAHIQLDQATKLILQHFQEEDHTYIYDNLGNKNKKLVCLYLIYSPKKNASRTDITDDDQEAYALCQHMDMGPLIFTVI